MKSGERVHLPSTQLTSFGRNNTVSVETAVILRRITSADVEQTRPATAAQLNARKALLPRNTHSADVLRKRDQLQQIQEDCASTKRQIESNFRERITLVHLGIDLKVEAEPLLSVPATRGKTSSGRPPTAPTSAADNSPLRLSHSEVLFRGFAVAKEAAAAMNAIDNLAKSVVQENAYLQHLRSKAEVTLRATAAKLIEASERNAKERGRNNVTKKQVGDDTSAGETESIPPHYQVIFEEWNSFLALCMPRTEKGEPLDHHDGEGDGSGLDADTQRELFVAFMRSRGNLGNSPDAEGRLRPSDRSDPIGGDGIEHQGVDPLDDLAPPSMPHCASASGSPRRATTTILTQPLQRAKMMLHAQGKQEHLDRLMELSFLAQCSGGGITPSPNGDATHWHGDDARTHAKQASPHRGGGASKSREDVQQNAHNVFARIHSEQATAHRTNMERQAERHQHHGLRLSRSKNLELYRKSQFEQHQLGLLHAAATKPSTLRSSIHDLKEDDMKSGPAGASSQQRLPSASASGPPSATHKLKPRAVGSAKSRPSSSSSTAANGTPRFTVTLDLPTIPYHVRPAAAGNSVTNPTKGGVAAAN